MQERNEQYIDHVKLKCNRFTQRISLQNTLICKASVFQDLLSTLWEGDMLNSHQSIGRTLTRRERNRQIQPVHHIMKLLR